MGLLRATVTAATVAAFLASRKAAEKSKATGKQKADADSSPTFADLRETSFACSRK